MITNVSDIVNTDINQFETLLHSMTEYELEFLDEYENLFVEKILLICDESKLEICLNVDKVRKSINQKRWSDMYAGLRFSKTCDESIGLILWYCWENNLLNHCTIIYEKYFVDDDCRRNMLDFMMCLSDTREELLWCYEKSDCGFNVILGSGITPLIQLVADNKIELVKFVLDSKADPDLCQNGWSALYEAVKRNNDKIVDVLLSFGADPYMVNEKGETPMSLAKKSRRQDLVVKFNSY